MLRPAKEGLRSEIMDRDTDVVSGWALAMQAQWPFLDSNLNHLVLIFRTTLV